MMKNKRALVAGVFAILVAVSVVAAVQLRKPKGPFVNDVAPGDPIEFRTFLAARIPDALAKTECTCCKKPLARCFEETVHKKPGGCPVDCGNCIIEGRVLLAMKRQGASDEEAAKAAVAVSRGKQSPPEGVSMDLSIAMP